ncbi:hypothetical protein BJX63DRAFT_332492 [Aspergillus granulosus]|uniref:Uncharacterized protein n=1 Tax=Aspergillus granulosus TaxID=176169 RepID=A0ABR4H571_9EURO
MYSSASPLDTVIILRQSRTGISRCQISIYPGCSSLIGLTTWNDPVSLEANSARVIANPYSWSNSDIFCTPINLSDWLFDRKLSIPRCWQWCSNFTILRLATIVLCPFPPIFD